MFNHLFDGKKPVSKEEWLNCWGKGGCYYDSNRYSEDGIDFGEWPRGREIRVFREATVSKKSADTVVYGIYQALDDIGLKLEVNQYEINNTLSSMRRSQTIHRPEIKHKGSTYKEAISIDDERLGELLFTGLYSDCRDENNGGRQHAIVILTDKNLESGRYLQRYKWGAVVDDYSTFDKGYMIISIPPCRQDSSSQRGIELLAAHGMGHLVGFCEHHEPEKQFVSSYSEPKSCVMKFPVRTTKLCERDKEALQVFWKALEKDFHMKFLK